MIRIAEQVSRAIRILRGNRDESARASHLVVNKDQFVNNELLQIDQAEREKCSQSTFSERKIMKTAFKRVALVAAAALAIGGITAVSAQATGASDWTISNAVATSNTAPGAGSGSSTETATQIAGVANYVTLTPLTGSPTVGVYFTISGGALTSGATSGTATGAVNIATPTVGTITVTSYAITNGAAATTATSTTTITVIASIPGTVFASATILGAGSTTTPTTTTDATFPVTAASGAQAANFTVAQADANSVALSSGNYKTVTATATGGLLTATNNLGTISGAASTYLSGIPTGTVNLSLTGLAGYVGTATVSISVNGGTAKTYSVTFTGAAVKIVLTAVNPVVAVGTAPVTNITANTNALEVQEFDANGNVIAANLGTISFTVGTTTVASVGASDVAGVAYLGGGTSGTHTSTTAVGYSVNGLAAGTTTIIANDSAGTLVSAPVSIRVSAASPTTVVYSTDAAAYATGAAGTLTVTLSDAAGTLPAGSYTLATGAATSSLAFAVAPSNLAALVTVNDSGVSSASFNAPLSDGTVSVGGTSTTSVTVTPASFTVASGASDAANAATDAANEATDAANAATDAANAAADSADAATQAAQDAGDKADAALAAVTALSQQVTTLLAKVAALASTLAKITKAIAELPKK